MRVLMRVCAAVLSVVWLGSARAATFTDLYIFGDSLADTGNISLLTSGGLPDPAQPYAPGRFSNGPLWVDHLAASLGFANASLPFLAGGNNFAFAGARSGADLIPPGLQLQTGLLHSIVKPVVDPNALYVMTGGANDLRDARGAGSTAASRQAAAESAAINMLGAVASLASQGVKHVLLTNAPDLGITPEAIQLSLVAQSTDVSMRYNAILGIFEGLLESAIPGFDLDLLSVFDWSRALVDDTLKNGGAVFGLTNATKPCAGFTGSTGVACDDSVFSDDLHPSAAAHALFGAAALERVMLNETPIAAARLAAGPLAAVLLPVDTTPVPEPGTALLLGGLLLGGLAARRTRGIRAGSRDS